MVSERTSGLVLVYAFNKENVLSVSAFFEPKAENRTEGNKLVFNWLRMF